MARVKIDNYAYPETPRIGLSGWLRWMWRQVTSMRVALALLLLLALAAIPGSILPQRSVDPGGVRDYFDANPAAAPVLDGLGFFNVYSSAWFTAIYVLLFLSLIGCIVPRVGVYWRRLREPVGAVPRTLKRFDPETAETPLSPREAVEAARAAVGPWRGFRTRVDGDDARVTLAAEHEHVREAGNLLFHLALVGILLAIGASTMLTFRGQAVIVEGGSFTNAVVSYDSFEAGAWFDEARLDPFTLTLESFEADFTEQGLAREFTATVSVVEPGMDAVTHDIEVNHPLDVEGARVYLQGNGYAPVITVHDAAGALVFSGAVPFLAQDAAYTSTGVVKIPDVTVGEQIGLDAVLYPSAATDGTSIASVHPDPTNPVIVFTAYTGDLRLDTGVPQNVYVLDESQLSPVRDDDGQVATMVMTVGDTVELPDGLGTVTFEELRRFVALDLRKDPSLPYVLTASVLSLIGLSGSLFAPRRRLYLVAERGEDGITVVTAGVAAPEHDDAAHAARDRLLAAVITPEDT